MIKISEGQQSLPFQSGGGGMLAYARLWERRFIALLGALFIACILLYMYFVMSSVIHVAARQELAGKVAAAKVAVSKLETAYLIRTKDITESYARSVGFVAASHETFVERGGAVTLHDAP